MIGLLTLCKLCIVQNACLPCIVQIACYRALFRLPVTMHCSDCLLPCIVQNACYRALFGMPVTVHCSECLLPCIVQIACYCALLRIACYWTSFIYQLLCNITTFRSYKCFNCRNFEQSYLLNCTH